MMERRWVVYRRMSFISIVRSNTMKRYLITYSLDLYTQEPVYLVVKR